MKKNLSDVKKEVLQRSFELVRESVNEEERTVDLAFSSEEPYERWFGNEVLGHKKKEVRMDFMGSGRAPLLLDHSFRTQIGVVETAKISSDGIGRATVRFSKSQQAQEIFDDIKDGIRNNVSVGYRVHEMELVSKKGDDPTYRITDWEPHEISIVSVPADKTVGVGRDQSDNSEEIFTKNGGKNTMEEEEENNSAEPQTTGASEVEIDHARNLERKKERERISTIMALGERHNAKDLAIRAVEGEMSLGAFRRDLLNEIEKRSDFIPAGDKGDAGKLGLSKKEQQSYSLFRAIDAYLKKDWSKAGLEHECHRALAGQFGEREGIWFPMDVPLETRATQTTTAADDLVPQVHRGDLFIDALVEKLVLSTLGARVLTGLKGTIHIPALDSSIAMELVAEGNAATEGNPGWATRTLTPHTVSGNIPITRTMRNNGSPDIESIIRMDMIRKLLVKIEEMAAIGSDSSNEPEGILSVTGINAVTLTSQGDPTWSEIVEMETKLAEDDALFGSLAYLFTPAMVGSGKVKTKDTGSGRFVIENNMTNGYKVERSSWLTANTGIFGNWEELYIGQFGAMEIIPDLNATTGDLTLGIFADFDVAVRHPVSFCKADGGS